MQGDAEIIEILNDVLTAELTAINQYFIHSKMCANWGYERLAEHGRARVDRRDEARRHDHRADPRTSTASRTCSGSYPVRVGETVPEQLQLDLELEYAAVERLNDGIAVCVDQGRQRHPRAARPASSSCEEEHVDWLETQQETIRQIGVENYLAQQLHELSGGRFLRVACLGVS